MLLIDRAVAAVVLTIALTVARSLPATAASIDPPAGAAPAPASTALPVRHRLFVRGADVIVVGAAVQPHVQSEFQPGSTAGLTSIEGWQTGEATLLGRFQVLSFTDYRSFSYVHNGSDPVITVGGTGMATVPSFRVHDDELESGGGVRILPRLYIGVALFKRQETSGYPPMTGAGYAVMFSPAPERNVTPYGWATYQPNAGGIYALSDGSHTALTYRGMRYRFGLLFAEPATRIVLDVGFAGENLSNRTNAPMRVNDSMVTIGIGTHF